MGVTAVQPQTMPSLAYTCRRGSCAHPECVRKHAQAIIPCSRCGQRIQPGELFHASLVVRISDGEAINYEQVHETCLQAVRS